MKKALVLGLGISGKSAATFLRKKGCDVVEVDDASQPKEFDHLRGFSLFVPSPGVPPSHPIYRLARESQIPIKGEAQLFLEQTNQPCIGVTGTNGKTTAVKMIEHILNGSGKKARALGNIGDPLTSYEEDDEEILVIELSSYQLETLSAKALELALILNIEEDHLDRYASFEEYAAAKARIQHCLKPGGQLLLHSQVVEAFPSLFSTSYSLTDQAVFSAVQPFGIDFPTFERLSKTFSRPPHRLEFVTNIDGIAYYNDSKGTTPSAVLYAIGQLEGKIVLLAGGRDKGLSFHPLRSVANRLSHVIAFGSAKKKVIDALDGFLRVYEADSMEEAVEKARLLARPNEIILLSPGGDSLDAYSNYAERGDAFKKIIMSLKKR